MRLSDHLRTAIALQGELGLTCPLWYKDGTVLDVRMARHALPSDAVTESQCDRDNATANEHCY